MEAMLRLAKNSYLAFPGNINFEYITASRHVIELIGERMPVDPYRAGGSGNYFANRQFIV